MLRRAARAVLRWPHCRYDEAIADFDKAFELGCKDAQVYNCRAMARKYRKNYDAAIQDLGMAINLDNTNVEYLYNRSQVMPVPLWDGAGGCHRMAGAWGSTRGDSQFRWLRPQSAQVTIIARVGNGATSHRGRACDRRNTSTR